MNANEIPLGKATLYPVSYDPTLLFPVGRKQKREEIGLSDSLPFWGSDQWTAFELSWLNQKGKPQVAVGEFVFPCESKSIVESKSLKLYLNSLNQTKLASRVELEALLKKDLSSAVEADVEILLYDVDEYQQKGFGKIKGECLDLLDIECEQYDYQPGLIGLIQDGARVHETLYSHLLKSNCLITSQPDWGTVVIEYEGAQIDHASLLRYIVSFRNHNEFHEQCVERIYQDIMRTCTPVKLTVQARYTRRGGLDINPWRSNHKTTVPFLRLARQ